MQEITPERAAILMAGEFHARNNPVFVGIQVGTVTKPLPDIEIQVGAIELDRTMLIFSRDVLPHKRKFNLTTSYTDPKVVGSLQLKTESAPIDPIVSLTLETKEDGTSTAEIEFVDELKVGDEVIVMAAQDQQTYYVIDRAVKFE